MKKVLYFGLAVILGFLLFGCPVNPQEGGNQSTSLSSSLSSSVSSAGGGGNLLKNGDFSSGTNHWSLWLNYDANAAFNVENGEAKITFTSPGSQYWYAGFQQYGFAMEAGSTYTLTFKARTDSPRAIHSLIQLNGSPWTRYSGDNSFTITGTMTEYSYTFNMYYPTDDSSDLEFFVAGSGAGTTYFDDMVLTKTADPTEITYPKVAPSIDRSNIIVYEIDVGMYKLGTWNDGNCIKGVTGRLNRIKELGINCIWLTPVISGEANGYWPYDYYRINPMLGTINDLKELVYEAHRKDIMVILDLVINHTWMQHPFFQDVLKNKSASPYKDYYLWKGAPGDSDFEYYYNWTTLPNLNLSNTTLKNYLFDMACYWINKYDIDGYRVDCAWALEDRYPGFSSEMTNRLFAVKTNLFLLAEGNVNEGRFIANGYNSAYDWNARGFDESSGIIGVFNGMVPPETLHVILSRSLPNNGMPFRFTENHDHPRTATLFGTNGSMAAHTIIMTSRGYPDVFGGGEVGACPAGIVDWKWLEPVVWDYNVPAFAYFKKIIAIRNQYLKSDLNQYWITNGSASIYSSLSVSGANRLIVLVNCTSGVSSAVLDLTIPQIGTINSLTELISGTNVPYSGGGTLPVSLDGYGTSILLIQ